MGSNNPSIVRFDIDEERAMLMEEEGSDLEQSRSETKENFPWESNTKCDQAKWKPTQILFRIMETSQSKNWNIEVSDRGIDLSLKP